MTASDALAALSGFAAPRNWAMAASPACDAAAARVRGATAAATATTASSTVNACRANATFTCAVLIVLSLIEQRFQRHHCVVIRLHRLGVDRRRREQSIALRPVHLKVTRFDMSGPHGSSHGS